MQTKAPQSLYLQSPKLNQLNILREVAADACITQAELARLCSLSVAMVNNYMKELCGSGLIEYHRKNSKTVTYHLTTSGEQYLDVLQLELIREMVGMFVAAKNQICARILSQSQAALQRVVLYGSGHLAQLAFHALELAGASILGVCDDNPEMIGHDFCGREVISPSQIRFIAPDAVVVADSLKTDMVCRNLSCLSDRGISIICLGGHSEQKATESPTVASKSAAILPSLEFEDKSVAFPVPGETQM